METLTKSTTQSAKDAFPLNGTDYVEFYVGNAKQSAFYYQMAFGYELVAYRGPETGHKETCSYVLQQDKIRLVFTSALSPEHDIARHVREHGDGVKVLALWVDDAEYSYNTAVERGAESVAPVETLTDDHGEVKIASIQTYGETIHTFVERKNYNGAFMPGFEATKRISSIKVGWAQVCRSLCWKCRTWRYEQMGEILSGCDGVQPY